MTTQTIHWGCSLQGSTGSQADLKAAIENPFHALHGLLEDLLAWRPQVAPYLQRGPGLIAKVGTVVCPWLQAVLPKAEIVKLAGVTTLTEIACSRIAGLATLVSA